MVEAKPNADDPCVVDLSKNDVYSPPIIPDADVETTLKVLRTLRNLCLGPDGFDADGAVLLSHTHAWIRAQVVAVQKIEADASASPRTPTSDAPAEATGG